MAVDMKIKYTDEYKCTKLLRNVNIFPFHSFHNDSQIMWSKPAQYTERLYKTENNGIHALVVFLMWLCVIVKKDNLVGRKRLFSAGMQPKYDKN